LIVPPNPRGADICNLAFARRHLHQTSTPIIGRGGFALANDDWKTTQQAEITQTTLQPSNDAEFALVITLQTGGYTAQLRGTRKGTGVGVVDVFALP
jgi:hypothetical protein